MSDIKIELTEGQIRDAIAVAIAEALTPQAKESLIRDVVRAHLSHPTGSYTKETILGKAVGDYIRGVATAVLNERLAEMEPQIRGLVRKSLGPQWEEGVLDSFEQALVSGFRVTGFSVQAHLADES